MSTIARRKPLITILIILLCWFLEIGIGFSQNRPLALLEKQIGEGNEAALFDLLTYFDSKKKIIESLGRHLLETTESAIAKRIMKDHFLLTEKEFIITDSTTQKEFTDFLNTRRTRIVFSDLAGAFLITPLEDRPVNIEFREISTERMEKIKTLVKPFFQYDWAHTAKLDSLIRHRSAVSLVTIASEFFKVRYRFDRYYPNPEEFPILLQYLTSVEIGVENEKRNISWHIENEYDPAARLNLLCYFVQFYKDYRWDNSRSAFVNHSHSIQKIEPERRQFQLLNDDVDSIAFGAFVNLTQCDPVRVQQLADEYTKAHIDFNHKLIPIFPYAFLKQLSLFTHYCRLNNIDFIGSEKLQSNLSNLRKDMSFVERRRAEDELISTLSLAEINAVEYWALVHEESWKLTYSAGRILDIFYSKNWHKLLANPQALDAYLKKSALFNALGIIGVCNNYLKKFSHSPASVIQMLQAHRTNDDDIKSQIQKIVSAPASAPKKKPSPVHWEGNNNYGATDLKKQLKELTHMDGSSKNNDRAISKLLSQISYAQIPTALHAIENYAFQSAWEKYSFMERDFGFFIIEDFDNRKTRDEFLRVFSKYSQYDLYDHYLDRANIKYKTKDGRLDFDKIYELLKYDVVFAFAGGGGGKHDNEVYPLIKLLELTFKTTLGFPNKLCNSNNMYRCSSDDRAQAWMEYLRTNKHLKLDHHEPPSFTFEE